MIRGLVVSIRGLIIYFLSAVALGQNPVPAAPESLQAPASSSSETERYCNSLLPGNGQAAALHQACIFALTLRERLPNFQCDMRVVKEEFRDTRPGHDLPTTIQQVTGRARYVSGKDYYDELRIDGKPVKDTAFLGQGSWSSGEFGMRLLTAFAPQLVPEISFARETTLNGARVFEYHFSVTAQNNTLRVWIAGTDQAHPGLEGKIWVAKSNARILRLETRSTDGVPKNFPVTSEATQTDFAYVDFRDGTGFVLPSVVKLKIQMRGTFGYRHTIRFTGCRKFRATGRIVSEPAN